MIERDNSLFLLVDIQEKLASLCDKSLPWIDNIIWLVKIAKKLKIPMLITEQYPKGLSHTLPEIQMEIDSPALEKLHFSCMSDENCRKAILNTHKKQIILVGIESHICIMQTAFECLTANLEVFVVVDAISSRFTIDHQYALKRLRDAGCELVTREMVVFEWLRRAGTEEFRTISKEFLR